MSRALSAIGLVAILGASASSAAVAAEVTLRPDLVPRLMALEEMYPLQGALSIVGTADTVDPLYGSFVSNVVFVDGWIEPGDAEKVAAIIPDRAAVVLNSLGGDFHEGLKLGQAIRDRIGAQNIDLLGVYVLEGGKCISACAIAFASVVDTGHNMSDMRFIETGGELGFHLPFVAESSNKPVAFSSVLPLVFDVLEAFNSLLSDGANPPDLVTAMLNRRNNPEDILRLHADILAWKFGFAPVATGAAISAVSTGLLKTETVVSLCDAYLRYSRLYTTGAEQEFSQRFDAFDNIDPVIAQSAAVGSNVAQALSNGRFYCRLDIHRDRTFTVEVFRGGPPCLLEPPGDPADDPNWYGKWCEVKPVDPAPSDGEAPEEPAYVRPSHRPPVRADFLAEALGCRALATDGWSVRQDANVRSEPSTDGAVIGVLAAGSTFKPASCAITADGVGVWLHLAESNGGGWVASKLVARPEWPEIPVDYLDLVYPDHDY